MNILITLLEVKYNRKNKLQAMQINPDDHEQHWSNNSKIHHQIWFHIFPGEHDDGDKSQDGDQKTVECGET